MEKTRSEPTVKPAKTIRDNDPLHHGKNFPVHGNVALMSSGEAPALGQSSTDGSSARSVSNGKLATESSVAPKQAETLGGSGG
jgi:hypothetical protein